MALVVVTLLQLLVSPAMAAPSPPSLITTTRFDYFALSEQWGPAACVKERCERKGIDIISRRNLNFTIHGLWPQRYNTHHPRNCNRRYSLNTATDLTLELKGRLNRYWPSYLKGSAETLSFWAHEWEAHGACSNIDKAPYFELGLQKYLTLGHNIKDIFTDAGIEQGNSYIPSKYFDAIKSATTLDTILYYDYPNPSSHRYVLFEVMFCLDYTATNFINCPFPHFASATTNAYWEDPVPNPLILYIKPPT